MVVLKCIINYGKYKIRVKNGEEHEKNHISKFKARLCNLSTIYTLVQIILHCGVCLVRYRMCNRISGLYALDASSIPLPCCDNHICIQASLGVTWGAKSLH